MSAIDCVKCNDRSDVEHADAGSGGPVNDKWGGLVVMLIQSWCRTPSHSRRHKKDDSSPFGDCDKLVSHVGGASRSEKEHLPSDIHPWHTNDDDPLRCIAE